LGVGTSSLFSGATIADATNANNQARLNLRNNNSDGSNRIGIIGYNSNQVTIATGNESTGTANNTLALFSPTQSIFYAGTTNTNPSEQMRLNSTGLGIGTNNPLTKLQVNSTAPTLRLEETTTGGSKRLELGVTSGGQAFIGANQSAQSLALQTVGVTRMTIGATGNVDISGTGTLNVDSGYVRAGGGSDPGTQLVMWTTSGGDGNIAAFQTIFSTGSNSARTERMRITNTGRITINNSEYTVIAGSVNGKTPNGTGFSFGYNPSGGSGESQLVWGTGGSTYPFIISSYDGSSTTERVRFATTGAVSISTSSSGAYTKVNTLSGENVVAYRVFDENHDGSSSTFIYPITAYYSRRDNNVRYTSPTTGNGASAVIAFTDRPGTATYPNNVRTSDILFYTAPNTFAGGIDCNPLVTMQIYAEGSIQFNRYGAGTLSTNASGVISASDGRMKTKTRDLTEGLSKIRALAKTTMYYLWNENTPMRSEHEEIGWAAQDVAAVIPEASPDPGDDKFRNYHDRAVIAYMAKAIDELAAQIESLKTA
jgi:hypothetical protein